MQGLFGYCDSNLQSFICCVTIAHVAIIDCTWICIKLQPTACQSSCCKPLARLIKLPWGAFPCPPGSSAITRAAVNDAVCAFSLARSTGSCEYQRNNIKLRYTACPCAPLQRLHAKVVLHASSSLLFDAPGPAPAEARCAASSKPACMRRDLVTETSCLSQGLKGEAQTLQWCRLLRVDPTSLPVLAPLFLCCN